MMYSKIDKIEIPQEGLEMTKQQCFLTLQKQQQELKLTTMLRLYQLELTGYIQLAFIGVLLILVIAYFSPHTRIAIVSFYFFLLGVFAIYEMYKQNIYEIDELLCTVYLNAGRSFLYKCLLCSIIQFLCFLFIVLIQVGIFHENLYFIILHSMLPIYLIQCLTMIFEKFIHNRKNVVILYISAYTAFMTLCQTINLQYISTSMISMVTLFVFFLFLLLLWMKYQKIRQEKYTSEIYIERGDL